MLTARKICLDISVSQPAAHFVELWLTCCCRQDHCIEALRQNLMCHGDVSVFTFKEFPELADQGIEGNWPDFEINHMCRNFESLRKWNNDHAAAWDYHA